MLDIVSTWPGRPVFVRIVVEKKGVGGWRESVRLHLEPALQTHNRRSGVLAFAQGRNSGRANVGFRGGDAATATTEGAVYHLDAYVSVVTHGRAFSFARVLVAPDNSTNGARLQFLFPIGRGRVIVINADDPRFQNRQ